MRNKLMLLAAGTVAALAFAALPTIASAAEMEFHCETGATCSGTIAGGAAALSNEAGETISCTAMSGSTSGTSTTTTMSVKITYTGCKETVSGFNFSCTNTTTAGKIETNSMTGHLITVTANNPATRGVLWTGANVTFSCASFLKRTLTGSLIWTFEEPSTVCNSTFQKSHKLISTSASHGVQSDRTYTGNTFALEASSDSGGAYSGFAIVQTWTVTYGVPVKITC
jgi:hypothetical protein